MDLFSTALDMLGALHERRMSSVELVESHLSRIERLNGPLNAIVSLSDNARTQAIEADAARARGEERPLLGLPITVKDAIDVRGLPTTSGVRRLADARPDRDAAAIARLRAAGAIVLGKTNTPPYAGDWQTDNRLYGRTNNPWDLERTPGGSTGGGAAAVAAGLSPLEVGSDIGGSIRLPAAFCGVFGHRPSAGLVPASGHVPGSSLPNSALVLNVLGPVARGTWDLDLALRTMMGPDRDGSAWLPHLPAPRHRELGAFRVGLLRPPEWQPVEPAIDTALNQVIAVVEGARGTVAEVDAPLGLASEHELFARMLAAEFSAMLRWDREERERQAMALEASGNPIDLIRAEGYRASAGDLMAMHGQRAQLRMAYAELFLRCDILLAPASLGVAFAHDARPMAERVAAVDGKAYPYFHHTVFAAPATISGYPATVFPAGQSCGLPVGLQAIGPLFEDRTSIMFADFITKEMGGFEPPPAFR